MITSSSIHSARTFTMSLAVAFLLLLATLASTGCQSTPRANPSTVDALDYDPVYNATTHVLRRYGFTLDRQDHRFGRVSTLPLAAPSFFEPWHNTNTSAEQIVVSSTNDQRRTVTIDIKPASSEASAKISDAENANPWNQRSNTDRIPAPTTYHLHVEVLVERFQNPIKHLTGSTSQGYLVARLRENPREYERAGIPGSYWQPLGRDTKLEQRILRDILKKSQKLRQKI